MLSTQPSNLPGQHRRQNSTPTILGTLKVPLLPATRPRNGSHRRSLSVDQPTNIQQQKTSSQDDRKVINRHEQHNLRETQQQQQQLVRPGQNQRHEPHSDRSLKGILLDPYPEYGSGTSTYSHFKNKLLEWDDEHQTNLRQPYEHEHLDNTKLDSNTFDGYLDNFAYETIDKALDEELKDGIKIDNLATHDNTIHEDTSMRASRRRPARQYTPPSQLDNS